MSVLQQTTLERILERQEAIVDLQKNFLAPEDDKPRKPLIQLLQESMEFDSTIVFPYERKKLRKRLRQAREKEPKDSLSLDDLLEDQDSPAPTKPNKFISDLAEVASTMAVIKEERESLKLAKKEEEFMEHIDDSEYCGEFKVSLCSDGYSPHTGSENQIGEGGFQLIPCVLSRRTP